jgi:ectoine hydroxylase-related dioxygenase (phytanoyl-CoA dioxygenase family)
MNTLTVTDQQDITGILLALTQDGGVIVADYIDSNLQDQLCGEFSDAIAAEPWCNTNESGPEFFGLKTKRLHGLLKHSAAAQLVLMHPLALSLAPQWLGGACSASTGELMAIGPGEKPQALHRDADSWQRANLPGEVLFSVNVALTEFTVSNGATVVVPGSHLWSRTRKPVEDESTFAEMPAGAALIYSGRVLHGGGGNVTDSTRIGLYWGYIPRWLRPIECFPVTMGTETIGSLPSEVQSMLGYSTGGFETVL